MNLQPHPSERRHKHGAVDRARRLRRDMTDAERGLWLGLRENRLGFRRQAPMGRYNVDFVDHAAKLVVELDGGQHNEPSAQAYDEERTAWLASCDYRVLRFWNSDVLENLEGVLETIVRAASPSPQPSPIKGEGARRRISFSLDGRRKGPAARRPVGRLRVSWRHVRR